MIKTKPMRTRTAPGAILKYHYMEPLNLSVVELAGALRISAEDLNGLIKGRTAMTPEFALKLSKLFNTTAKVWMNLERKLS